MIVTWNVMGMNKEARHREIYSSLLDFKVPIITLLETRIKETNADRIRNKLGSWKIEDNYKDHSIGRISILWKTTEKSLQLIHTSGQHMHMEVYDLADNLQVLITVVYAYNQLDRRRTLWQDGESIGQGIHVP